VPKTKQHEVRYIPARELRVSKKDDGTRTISGYAAVFNALSVDLGSWHETIAPGAFTKSLMTNPDVVCLRDHDSAILLGRTRSKTLTLEQDTTGLKFACDLPATTQAADLIALIERGDIDGCSFSFICNLDDWKTSDDGVTTRTLIDVDLFDVSVVSEPAYPDTTLSLRSAPKEIRSAIETRKKAKRDDSDDSDGTEDNSAPKADTECTCDCAECIAGDCDDCTGPDCSIESCSCAMSNQAFRNKAHMVLTMAALRLN
jgi:HK97 family phage prohead protease